MFDGASEAVNTERTHRGPEGYLLPEIWLYVFASGCNGKILARCRQVCKNWLSLLDDSGTKPLWCAQILAPRYLMPELCRKGLLNSICWLASRFGREALIVEAGYERYFTPIRAACASGRLDVARWLAATYGYTSAETSPEGKLVDAYDQLAMRSACVNGHQEVVEWLVKTFKEPYPGPMGHEAEDRALDENEVLVDVCNGGGLELARWLIDEYNLGERHGLLFVAACAQGDLELAKTYERNTLLGNFPSGEVTLELGGAFVGACSNGHLHVARWLRETYCVPYQVVALSRACANGHLAVVKWLAAEFGLVPIDIRAHYNRALRTACQKGHLATAIWLTDTFELTAEDAQEWDNYAFSLSCIAGQEQVVRWMDKRFTIKISDNDWTARTNPLRSACKGGHIGLVKWILATFTLSDYKVGPLLREMQDQCRYNIIEILQTAFPAV
jgi:hypothetical protein